MAAFAVLLAIGFEIAGWRAGWMEGTGVTILELILAYLAINYFPFEDFW